MERARGRPRNNAVLQRSNGLASGQTVALRAAVSLPFPLKLSQAREFAYNTRLPRPFVVSKAPTREERMISRVRQGCFAAMLIASSWLVSVPACAQSLALSYKLDVNSAQLQRVSISNDGCADVSWVATVTTCARVDALGRFSWSAPADDEATRSQFVGTGEDGGKSAPAAGAWPPSEANEVSPASRAVMTGSAASSAPTDARLGAAAARDDAAASLKPDVTLRLASKPRSRSGGDEAKYTDAALENRNQKNNFNALGVELLIPFH